MPYTDQHGNLRYSDREQYHHFKKIADDGKAPERKLRDGTVIPAKNLTRTEVVRYANKAESARKRLTEFVQSDKYKGPRSAPVPVAPAPKPAKQKKPKTA